MQVSYREDPQMPFDAEALAEALSIAETRIALGKISNPTVYALINSGELASFKIGRRRFVSRAAIADFIRRREQAERESQRELGST